MVRPRQNRAFTLVELLVVIAIIAILIALLIGPIMRARRQALVLACPIAARAAKDSVVLVHPHGSAELELCAPSLPGSHCGPEWSTNGTWVGYSAVLGTGSSFTYRTVIVHPLTGKTIIYQHPDGVNYDLSFAGWADDDHFITHTWPDAVPGFFIREAGTGRVTETYKSEWAAVFPAMPVQVRRVPPGTGAYYIATIYRKAGDAGAVALLRKDFSIKRMIYVARNAEIIGPGPSVDPFGEYAAWTNETDPTRVAVKWLKSPMSEPPFQIPLPDPTFRSMFFCDWTEDGTILASTHNDPQILLLITRTGKLLRTVRQDRPYFYPAASYRKYLHQ